jgi:hypothetical protein
VVGGGGQAKLGSGALEGRLLACCAHSTVAVRVEARLAAGDMGDFRSLDYLVLEPARWCSGAGELGLMSGFVCCLGVAGVRTTGATRDFMPYVVPPPLLQPCQRRGYSVHVTVSNCNPVAHGSQAVTSGRGYSKNAHTKHHKNTSSGSVLLLLTHMHPPPHPPLTNITARSPHAQRTSTHPHTAYHHRSHPQPLTHTLTLMEDQ